MSPGVGYIGAGNIASVFTRKNKMPFDKIKAIYGDEMERLKSEKTTENKSLKKLTESEKLIIRKRVKTQIRKERNKNLIIGSIAILVIIGVLYFVSN